MQVENIYLKANVQPINNLKIENAKLKWRTPNKYAKGGDLAKPGAKMIDEERAGRAAIVTSNELIRGAKSNQSASVWRKSTAKLPQSNG